MSEVSKPRIGDYRRHLLVCTGPRCTQNGEGQALFDSLGDKLKAAGLTEGELRVKRSRVSCFFYLKIFLKHINRIGAGEIQRLI